VKAPLDALSEDDRDALQRRGMPNWTASTLATLTHDYCSSKDRVYERKLMQHPS